MNSFHSENTIVAFLDILGFKDLVNNNGHDKLIRVYQNLLLPIVQHSSTFGKYKVIKKEDGQSLAVADSSKAVISSLVISDSIVLWTPIASMKSFIDIAIVVRNLLVSGMYSGLPLRGAISIGPLSMINDTIEMNNELSMSFS